MCVEAVEMEVLEEQRGTKLSEKGNVCLADTVTGSLLSPLTRGEKRDRDDVVEEDDVVAKRSR